jgi:hypothetical protein
MADCCGLQCSANTRNNSRILAESLSRVVQLNQESDSMMETSLSELNTSCQDRDIGESAGRNCNWASNNSCSNDLVEDTTSYAYDEFLKAASNENRFNIATH